MEPIVEEVICNIARSRWDAFIQYLRDRLADHDDYQVIEGRHPLLPKQLFPDKPAKWMHIKLVGDNNDTATLAIRSDNVYLIGFMNQEGHSYEFGWEGSNARMIPGSTFLGCDVSYGSLVRRDRENDRSLVDGSNHDGSWTPVSRRRRGRPASRHGNSGRDEVKEELVTLELGESSARDAVRRLSHYAPRQDGIADRDTKLALARLIVMICESARMTPFLNTVGDAWAGTSVNHVRRPVVNISPEQVDYLWNWKKMSDAVLGWSGFQHLRRIGIGTRAEALRVVHLLLNRPMRASADGHGRPLVELLAVRADFCVVGTIAVFDGKRGQIIYAQRDHDPVHCSRYQGLVLTGPYRAISADGSVTIKISGIPCTTTDTSDQASTVGRAMLWDAYAEQDQKYDTALTRTITIKVDPSGTSDESGTFWECNADDSDSAIESSIITREDGDVVVTYAVLSSAVEATVQVDMLLLAGVEDATADSRAHVCGDITAFTDGIDAGRVLFRCGMEDRVEVSSACSIVPLARSVVAVPIRSRLTIKVRLRVEIPNESAGIISFRDDLEFNGYGKRQIDTAHGRVQVKVLDRFSSTVPPGYDPLYKTG